jgi:hypothetical protein
MDRMNLNLAAYPFQISILQDQLSLFTSLYLQELAVLFVGYVKVLG